MQAVDCHYLTLPGRGTRSAATDPRTSLPDVSAQFSPPASSHSAKRRLGTRAEAFPGRSPARPGWGSPGRTGGPMGAPSGQLFPSLPLPDGVTPLGARAAVSFLASAHSVRLRAESRLFGGPCRQAAQSETRKPRNFRSRTLEGSSTTSSSCSARPAAYFGRIAARSQTRGSDASSRSRTPGFDLWSAAKRSPSRGPR